MPPKKGSTSAPGKKTVEKAKAKIVEDKTFGLKNKKGTKQQKFITTVEKTVLHGNRTAKQQAKEQELKQSKKDEKKKQADELNTLFKPVEQKVSKGVDPKSVLCAFYKAGQCKKGEKCKFSHDLNIGRKGEKRNMYDDGDKANEGMEDWDEAKLEEVVNQKHGEANKSMPATVIICKHFLDAVENNKYGWFWSCPGGDKCHYKHALPPGFVLKKDMKKDDKKDEISLEELIEKERAALSSNNLTKVTLESFLKWKDRKRKEKITKAKKARDNRKAGFKTGNAQGISGREMFEFDPDLVMNLNDDEEAGDDFDLSQFRREEHDMELNDDEVAGDDFDRSQFRREEHDMELNDDEVAGDDFDLKKFRREEHDMEAVAAEVYEIREDMYVETAPDASDKACTQRLQDASAAKATGEPAPLVNGVATDEANKLDMAGALPAGTSRGNKASQQEVDAAIAIATAAVANGDVMGDGDIDIDENLFDGDDLFDVEEELETLELHE